MNCGAHLLLDCQRALHEQYSIRILSHATKLSRSEVESFSPPMGPVLPLIDCQRAPVGVAIAAYALVEPARSCNNNATTRSSGPRENLHRSFGASLTQRIVTAFMIRGSS